MRDSNIETFFALIRVGLWCEGNQEIQIDGTTDWNEVYRLAQEQSVQGLVLVGLEHSDIKPPKELLLQWIGEVQMIERRNKAMNVYIAELVEELRSEGIYTLLVKGQGLAQYYNRPNWRSSGDVDLFLSEDNYRKAVQVLRPVASSIDEENECNKHLAMTINGWTVELHGTLRSGLWQSLDRGLDKVQNAVFNEGKVSTWMNEGSQVFLPNADENVVFVFAHILQHFYKEGIGLRQICDWCRLLWEYRDSVDWELLKFRLFASGIESEWKAFASFVVDYLGMPEEAMPFYSPVAKWSRRAKKIMGYVLKNGNFGHNRDYSYQKKYPFIIYKAISFWKHLKDGVFFFSLFPLDSIKVTWRRMVVGIAVVLQGKKHE